MNSTSDALGEPGRSCNPRKPEDSQGTEAFSNFLCLSSQGHTLLGLLGAHMCPPCSEAFSVSCYLSSPGVGMPPRPAGLHMNHYSQRFPFPWQLLSAKQHERVNVDLASDAIRCVQRPVDLRWIAFVHVPSLRRSACHRLRNNGASYQCTEALSRSELLFLCCSLRALSGTGIESWEMG